MSELEGKIAFITGATRGIGWQTARLFSKSGCKTVIINGHGPQLEERAKELESVGSAEVIAIRADFSSPDEIKQCYRTIFERCQGVDIVVNNAGVMEDALIGMIGDEQIMRSFNLNAIGVLHSIQQAARLMIRKKQGGAIVNVSSLMAIHGNVGQMLYCSSKAALLGMTKAAAKELAKEKIRVNCIAPGLIETDLTEKLPKAIYDQKLESIMMQRAGTAEEVAELIVFLAGPKSCYITGQVIAVDGAMRV